LLRVPPPDRSRAEGSVREAQPGGSKHEETARRKEERKEGRKEGRKKGKKREGARVHSRARLIVRWFTTSGYLQMKGRRCGTVESAVTAERSCTEFTEGESEQQEDSRGRKRRGDRATAEGWRDRNALATLGSLPAHNSITAAELLSHNGLLSVELPSERLLP